MCIAMAMSGEFSQGQWLANPPIGEEVCITGMSGQFPNSRNLEVFGEKILNKEDLVSHTRWTFQHPEIPKRGGTICDIERLDAGYFGLHHRQVNTMDPMMRKLLEAAIECIMDAGLNPIELEGTVTGVFIGCSFSDDEWCRLTSITDDHCFPVTGYLKTFQANRLSYLLKLKGPSFVADTACSSSLTVLTHAYQSIRCGLCDSALVGTANLVLNAGSTLQFQRLGVLSSDGRSKVFDEHADGYVRGETISIILLQKTKDAKRIYAQIVHSKMNSDGYKEYGITYPSKDMQARLMTEIYKEATVLPSELSYLEAHGTGTAVGDPQELGAIDEAIGQQRNNSPLWIGSVKSNLGHTEAASGFNSLVKVVTALETGWIPPNINLTKLRDFEGFTENRLRVVTELTPLKGDLVGINNFGFGGSNVHLILKRVSPTYTEISVDEVPRLVCVSGRTKKAVDKMLNGINSKPFSVDFIGLVHNIFNKPFPVHYYRGYTIVSRSGVFVSSTKSCRKRQKLCLIFAECLEQYHLIGQALLKLPDFKATMLQINDIVGFEHVDIINELNQKKLGETHATLISLAVQVGIVKLLKELSVYPDVIYDQLSEGRLEMFYKDIISLNEMFHTFPQVDVLDSREARYFNKDMLNMKRQYPTGFQSKNMLKLGFSVIDVNKFDDGLVSFLDVVGRLYVNGQNPHIAKLYPPVKFPVRRNTPMIAPLIRWHHPKWHTYKFIGFDEGKTSEKLFVFPDKSEEYGFTIGHVIDGRALLPATLYLYLVWQVFSHERSLLPLDIPVVFTNCRFMTAVNCRPDRFTRLDVAITKSSGRFEIFQGDQCVVSGTVESGQPTLSDTDFPVEPLDDEEVVLNEQEIYTELNLRGYNYTGAFKGLLKCNVDATKGLIKWEKNWVSFMDTMLQMKILQIDSRQLYVPTGIKKLVIDPAKHVQTFSAEDNPKVPVRAWRELNLIKSGGIEIEGLRATSISRQNELADPVLEQYTFVANETALSKEQSMRIMTQIILENTLEKNVNAVELDGPNSDYLLPLMSQAMSDLPLINPTLTIAAESVECDMNDKSIKVEPFHLKADSQVSIIVGTHLLQRNDKSHIIALKDNGYIISREDVGFESKSIDQLNIIAVHQLETETLVLVNRQKALERIYVEVTDDLAWLPKLKMLPKHQKVVLYARNAHNNGLLGLVNCLRREPLGNRFMCIFMDDETCPPFDAQDDFYRTQIVKNQAVNVYKNGVWGTYRHLLLTAPEEIDCDRAYISCRRKGDLSSIVYKQSNPFNGHTNLLQTYYSAINFKDIMIASGRINADYFCRSRFHLEEILGIEFSGKTSTGKRVMGMRRGGAGSNTVLDADILLDVPDTWSLEEAATVPVVYMTLLYALFIRTTLQPGASILIHSAVGGVGMAALNIALHYKCHIYVTVGTTEKKQLLKELYPYFQTHDHHIGNSHDTSFEAIIKRETRGHGVDIVLNSLAEDKLRASIGCLKQGGCLLELGKYDLVNNHALELCLLEKSASYHGIIADEMSEKAVKDELSAQLQRGIREGYIKPLPRTCFHYSQVEEAYRYMSTGKHVGKILLKLRDEEEAGVVPSTITLKGLPSVYALEDKSYVIIGGLGGFGLELVDWLVLKGAKKVVLSSRTGIQSGYQAYRINLWKSYGVQIVVSTLDVTTGSGCEQLITLSNSIGPVDAIFNLAAVLADDFIDDQDLDKFQTSLKPKAVITGHLDELSRALCPSLRYFVVFSSVSCGRGNAGQSNYGFANAVMERICERRHIDGLPALAVQWGAIGQVGLVARMQQSMEIGGTLQQSVASCLEALDRFMNQSNPIVGSMVVAEKKSTGAGTAIDAVAQILGIKNVKNVSLNATLPELGMDSMRASEILQVLDKDFGIVLSPKSLRTLTFNQLYEIESEKENREEPNNKVFDMADMNYVPYANPEDLSIIPLCNSDDNEIPIVFVLPGFNGELNDLSHLLENMSVQAWGLLYSYKNPELTITDMVFKLLPHVWEKCSVSNSRRIILMGYSFGSIVAIEMQKHLEERNINSEAIFIDGAPAYIRLLAETFPTQQISEIENVLIYQTLATFASTQQFQEPTFQDRLLSCNSYEEKVQIARDLIDDEFIEHNYNLDQQAVTCIQNRLLACLNYQIPANKFTSQAYLFKASLPAVTLDSDDYNLSDMYGSVEVKEIAGSHRTITENHELLECIRSIVCE